MVGNMPRKEDCVCQESQPDVSPFAAAVRHLEPTPDPCRSVQYRHRHLYPPPARTESGDPEPVHAHETRVSYQKTAPPNETCQGADLSLLRPCADTERRPLCRWDGRGQTGRPAGAAIDMRKGRRAGARVPCLRATTVAGRTGAGGLGGGAIAVVVLSQTALRTEKRRCRVGGAGDGVHGQTLLFFLLLPSRSLLGTACDERAAGRERWWARNWG